jgi:hypothetical protein
MLFFPLNGLPCQTKRRTQAIEMGDANHDPEMLL